MDPGFIPAVPTNFKQVRSWFADTDTIYICGKLRYLHPTPAVLWSKNTSTFYKNTRTWKDCQRSGHNSAIAAQEMRNHQDLGNNPLVSSNTVHCQGLS